MSTFKQVERTVVGYSQLPTTALVSIQSTELRYSDFLSASTIGASTRAAEWVSPSVNALWSSTAVKFGWMPLTVEAQPSDLPYPTNAADAEGGTTKVPVTASPLRILLVEDNAADMLVVKEVLKQFGIPFSLQTASDGAEAISLLEQYESDPSVLRPALILLDLNLPKVSGTQVLTHIRQHEWSRQIPVVIVTSSDSPNDLKAIQRIGATAYFRKPTSLAAYMQLGRVILQVLPEPEKGA